MSAIRAAIRRRVPPSGPPLRWRLALLYGALAAVVLLLLGVALYREIDAYLARDTGARLRAQAQATIDRHTSGSLGLSVPFQVARPATPDDEAVPGDRIEFAASPLLFFESRTVLDSAAAIVAELGTRDTSALVLNREALVVVDGASIRVPTFIQLPPMPFPAIGTRYDPPPLPERPPPPDPPIKPAAHDERPPPAGATAARPAAVERLVVAGGVVVPATVPAPAPDLDRVQTVMKDGAEQTYIVDDDQAGRQLVMLLPLRRQLDGATIGALQVATSLEPADDLLARLRLLLGLGLGGALALSLLVGVPLTRAALRPLDRLVETTERIAAEDLSARSHLAHRRDEIGRLAASYDRMLDRLEASFQTQRQFVADAAHELRTPLQAIAGLIELLLIGADEEDRATRRRTLQMVDHDLTRLTRLVNDLLALSRQEITAPWRRRPVDLSGLAAEIAALTRELSPDRTIALERPPGDMVVSADPDQLRQVLLNLTDNARRHTPDGGPITIRVRRAGRSAEVAVIDAGAGIQPEDLQRIFERFYRGDRARRRAGNGAGLGLAIARAIAEAHGGTLTTESAPGAGATFLLRLPLAGGRPPRPALAPAASSKL